MASTAWSSATGIGACDSRSSAVSAATVDGAAASTPCSNRDEAGFVSAIATGALVAVSHCGRLKMVTAAIPTSAAYCGRNSTDHQRRSAPTGRHRVARGGTLAASYRSRAAEMAAAREAGPGIGGSGRATRMSSSRLNYRLAVAVLQPGREDDLDRRRDIATLIDPMRRPSKQVGGRPLCAICRLAPIVRAGRAVQRSWRHGRAG